MNFRDEVVELVKTENLRRVAEIGVWRGELSAMLAPLVDVLVLVDPWSALWNDFEHGGKRYDCTMGGPVLNQWSLNEMHDDLRKQLPGALILRMPSVLAAQHVPDQSLDLVFIDAVHTYHHCYQDIRVWLPKIRTGGWIAGDDYVPNTPGAVAAAVDQWFPRRQFQRPPGIWKERVTR